MASTETYEVDLRLVAHISLHLGSGIDVLSQRQRTVHIVPAQSIYDRLDGLEGALVQDEVTLENVDYAAKVSDGHVGEKGCTHAVEQSSCSA